MNRKDVGSEVKNLIHRKSAKDYAKSIREYDNLLSKDDDDDGGDTYNKQTKTESSVLFSTRENIKSNGSSTLLDEGYISNENLKYEEKISKTLGYRMFSLFDSIIFQTNDWIEKNIFFNKLKNLVTSSHECESSPDTIKQVIQTINEKYKFEHPYNYICIEKLCQDLKLYGRILHGILYLVLFLFLFVSTQAMYRTCSLNDYAFIDWLTELGHCKLSDTTVQFIKINLIVTNIITFMIIVYDKYQACKQGYRISESLIIFCLFSGGLPTGWFFLFALNHKTKRFKFMLYAVIATFISVFWIYLYNLLNM